MCAATQPPRQITKAPISESFNLDSALTGSDDGAERWLIQKDKLDFGPFSMREVRSQIESGKIVGEHVIVDTENGERRKVKDHPALRQLALDSEVRQAEQHRMDQESSERRTHKRRVVSLLGAMFVVVLGAGGGAFWYLSHMKPKVVTQVIHDQADLDFLKGVRIVMKVDSPAHHGHSGRHHAAGHGGKNAFDDVTRLGDASQGGSEETLDQSVVQRVMSQNWRVLVGCIREERHRNSSLHDVNMDFIIKGSGQVSAVRVNGQTGTAFAGCMYGKMQSVTFPKFNGDKTHASFSLALK